MSFRGSKDYALEVALGNIPGVAGVNKFGRNPDLNGIEDVWEGGGIWVAPTTARLHDIASDSASDDGAPVGVGARTIRVYGLTAWNLAEVSEDIVLNGVANVPTVNAYVIVHRMKVLTKGASGPNVGTITATAQTDGTVTAQIDPGVGQTQMAIYGVPSIQSVFLSDYYASMNRTGGATALVDIELKLNPEPDAELLGFLTKGSRGLLSSATSGYQQLYNPYAGTPGPLIFKVQGDASAASDVSAGFNLYLVDN